MPLIASRFAGPLFYLATHTSIRTAVEAAAIQTHHLLRNRRCAILFCSLRRSTASIATTIVPTGCSVAAVVGVTGCNNSAASRIGKRRGRGEKKIKRHEQRRRPPRCQQPQSSSAAAAVSAMYVCSASSPTRCLAINTGNSGNTGNTGNAVNPGRPRVEGLHVAIRLTATAHTSTPGSAPGFYCWQASRQVGV